MEWRARKFGNSLKIDAEKVGKTFLRGNGVVMVNFTTLNISRLNSWRLSLGFAEKVF
jgi:hypothetical protein